MEILFLWKMSAYPEWNLIQCQLKWTCKTLLIKNAILDNSCSFAACFNEPNDCDCTNNWDANSIPYLEGAMVNVACRNDLGVTSADITCDNTGDWTTHFICPPGM